MLSHDCKCVLERNSRDCEREREKERERKREKEAESRERCASWEGEPEGKEKEHCCAWKSAKLTTMIERILSCTPRRRRDRVGARKDRQP